MEGLRELIRRVAPTDLSVLIEGPTGSGKELVATALHTLSGRRGQLVSVNVCAVSEHRFEADFFGHTRGAFTGAREELAGYVMEADGGTLFLDEIGTLPMAMQAKLLRTVEDQIVRPVGGRTERRAQFRLVSATNEPLIQRVRSGGFREDFYHRLSGLTLTMPALCDRTEDITALLGQFWVNVSEMPELSASGLALLHEHPWPGNVRELLGFARRAQLLSAGRRLDAAAVTGMLAPVPVDALSEEVRERRYVRSVLDDVDWDVRSAAVRLNCSRATVYRWMTRLRLVRTRRARALSGV